LTWMLFSTLQMRVQLFGPSTVFLVRFLVEDAAQWGQPIGSYSS
jgi:hypothetical protein